MRAARDLAQNQIRTWKIGNDQSRPLLSASKILPRKRNDNNFACYRFDHAASSSGEFQSRPRTDSLSSAPLNDSSRACSGDSLPIDSSVLMTQLSHGLPRRTRSTQRIFLSRNMAMSDCRVAETVVDTVRGRTGFARATYSCATPARSTPERFTLSEIDNRRCVKVSLSNTRVPQNFPLSSLRQDFG